MLPMLSVKFNIRTRLRKHLRIRPEETPLEFLSHVLLDAISFNSYAAQQICWFFHLMNHVKLIFLLIKEFLHIIYSLF